MRMEHPRAYRVLEQNCYKTPVKRLQGSCQEIARLLSRDYSTPVKRLQHSCQEIARLLSRDCKTPVKRLQHSCQEITALLSRDCKTPVKRLQDSSQEIKAKHNKMIEYLNSFLLCTLLTLIFYLYIRVKRYLALLKMADDNLVSFDFDAPQSDSKRQKLLECGLIGNSKLYLGKVCICIWVRSDQIKNLAMRKWINFLIIMKLSSQVRW